MDFSALSILHQVLNIRDLASIIPHILTTASSSCSPAITSSRSHSELNSNAQSKDSVVNAAMRTYPMHDPLRVRDHCIHPILCHTRTLSPFC